MRISTSTIYDLGITGIQQQTASMIKTQQQISSGRRILTPADDPVASARVLELSQSKALNQQYDVNTDSASGALGLEDTVLESVSNLILDVRTAALTAGGPSQTSTSLSGLATGLRGRYQELLGLANSTDGIGQYMFSGYKGTTVPFTETAPGNVTYNGDQGQRLIQITPSRQIATSDAGLDVFTQNKNGTNQSLFTTLNNLITALEAGPGPGLATSLKTAVSDLDNGLERVLTVRASVGTRMNEIDAVKSSGEDIALQYDQILSGLQDLDYAKAITDLTRQTAQLEAAQKSFMNVQGLSLFNFIS